MKSSNNSEHGGQGQAGAAGGSGGGYMDTIQNFFGSLKGTAIKYEDQVLDVVEAGLDHVEARAKQLHSSLATLSSLEARQAALTSLKRQAKEIESMLKEDETRKFVSGGVASYVHGLERALEARGLVGVGEGWGGGSSRVALHALQCNIHRTPPGPHPSPQSYFPAPQRQTRLIIPAQHATNSYDE
jgi:hypothetical protein